MLLCSVLVGCPSPPKKTLSSRLARPDEPLPSYRQVIDRYNENIRRVEQLWTRAVVELRWTDEEGTHFEQGEGNLILQLPDRVAVSVGKLGHTLMWIGGDEQQYWFFDLRDRHVLYMGRHDQADQLDPKSLPVPIRPRDLPRLLGVIPIDPTKQPPDPQVEWYDGKLLIEPPGTRTRLLLDPITAQPVRIDLMDTEGQSRVIGQLSAWEPMKIEGLPPGAYPKVATRLEVALVDKQGSATLFLSDATDGRRPNRIKPAAFDIQRLVAAFKPKRVVDLDR